LLYTIGYGGMSNAGQLKEIMEENGIDLLVDVRTSTRAWSNEFNGTHLAKFFGTQYVWMGERLGGLKPVDPVALNDLYQIQDGRKVLIMCSEKDPAQCHRHYWIAAAMMKRGIVATHLIYKGQPTTADLVPIVEGGAK